MAKATAVEPTTSDDVVVADQDSPEVVDLSEPVPPKTSKRVNANGEEDWGGVQGADGTHYTGEAHESLTDAFRDNDGEPVYAVSRSVYDPETRVYKGQRWEYVDVTQLPPGPVPGEYRLVRVVD